MAKKPPEKYNAGELDHTRRNLGNLSLEESRRMAQLLGGEVGVERADLELEKKYQKLHDLNRRKSDRFLPAAATSPGASRYEKRAKHRTDPRGEKNPSYLNRIKMNFLAARSSHGIKTYLGAVASLFSFLFPVRDTINPRFIIRGDEIFFHHIESLVLAVRGLSALNQKYSVNRLQSPFFITILSILKDWDIVGLHQELTHLQIAPRSLTVKYCSNLVRMMYTPIIRLSNVNDGYHIANALKRLYDLDLLSLPERHPDIEKIKNYYNSAAMELDYIFRVLKFQCYPILMKVACTAFSRYSSFFFQNNEEILEFLGLSPQDIVTVPRRDKQETDTADEPEEVDEEISGDPLESPVFQKGFEILERLFPQAGWQRLGEFPDLYPYFRSLFVFPRGFELVPQEDPIQQIVILISILQELFYGFRSIQFGYMRNPDGTVVEVGPQIEKATEDWRVLFDELLAKEYLSHLYEFCREVEKNPRFATSVFGVKQLDYLSWIRKLHLMPHLVINRPRPREITLSEPKLYELTPQLRHTLTYIARDLADPSDHSVTSIENPWENFAFEIESPISRRLREVLKLHREDTNNANLLLYTFSILLILDELINNARSHCFPYLPACIYRRESEDTDMPLYTVPAIDTSRIFRESEKKLRQLQEPPSSRKEGETSDSLTGLHNQRGIRQAIQREIDLYRREKIPFSLLAIQIRDFSEYCEQNGEESGVDLLAACSEVLRGSIREYKDVPARVEDAFFIVLLPGTVKEEAVNLAIRCLSAFSNREDDAIPIALGIVQFLQTWGKDKTMRVAKQAAEEATKVPPPSLCLYDEKRNSFQTLQE